MEKLMGLIVIGFLLSSCSSGPSYNSNDKKNDSSYKKSSNFEKNQAKKTECVTHSKTGIKYCYSHTHQNSALNVAIMNCKKANPNYKDGCKPNKKISKTNTNVAILELLIKDLESGKISKTEFNKRKKILLAN